MQKELELFLSINQSSKKELFKEFLSQALKIETSRIKHFIILKKSLDARKGNIRYYFKFKVFIDEYLENDYPSPFYLNVKENKVIHIAGCGPAGLFAALELLKNGIKPVIFERGKTISERKKDIAILHREHIVNPDSNYCFGEGGAGTFSDGKLYTRTKKRGDIADVLKTFVAHGASEEILYDASPHIGTDILPAVISSIRNTILKHGGEIHFNSKITDIEIENGKIQGVFINNKTYVSVNQLILATGHSARDIYKLLFKKGVLLEAKPFALGVRVEHPQELINSIQYHSKVYDNMLPAAAYKLVEQVNGRGVFSFCMCPGGIIVPSATTNNQMVLNGMSNSIRNSPFANAGIVAQVNLEDVENISQNALYLMYFQEATELKCLTKADKAQKAPAQRLTDFVHNKLSSSLPACSYSPGVVSENLNKLLPYFIGDTLRKAFPLFDKKMKGFFTSEAIVLATESRTSSPVRIPRNKDTLEHISVEGLYPCGEGAGYAGGITSSALDGINCAKMATQKKTA